MTKNNLKVVFLLDVLYKADRDGAMQEHFCLLVLTHPLKKSCC